MDLKEILAITGKPGLYNLVSQAKSGVIVESLDDNKKRFPVFSHENLSSLEEISIFTDTDDMPLKNILKKMFEKHEGGASISTKSSANELKAYFEEILPEYDKERVYVSHIKKVISWYNILQKKEMLDFSDSEENKEQSDNKE
ncbi:MAG: DUF5606 domain-containing protein [Bacteroidota bacterium]|nr:DUF5606 domain-containing protein [Bacteroidota bacterium]